MELSACPHAKKSDQDGKQEIKLEWPIITIFSIALNLPAQKARSSESTLIHTYVAIAFNGAFNITIQRLFASSYVCRLHRGVRHSVKSRTPWPKSLK